LHALLTLLGSVGNTEVDPELIHFVDHNIVSGHLEECRVRIRALKDLKAGYVVSGSRI